MPMGGGKPFAYSTVSFVLGAVPMAARVWHVSETCFLSEHRLLLHLLTISAGRSNRRFGFPANRRKPATSPGRFGSRYDRRRLFASCSQSRIDFYYGGCASGNREECDGDDDNPCVLGYFPLSMSSRSSNTIESRISIPLRYYESCKGSNASATHPVQRETLLTYGATRRKKYSTRRSRGYRD